MDVLTTKSGVTFTWDEAQDRFYNQFQDYITEGKDITFRDWMEHVLDYSKDEMVEEESKFESNTPMKIENKSHSTTEVSKNEKLDVKSLYKNSFNERYFENLIESLYDDDIQKGRNNIDNFCDYIKDKSLITSIHYDELHDELSSFLEISQKYKQNSNQSIKSKLNKSRDNLITILSNIDADVELRSLYDRVIETLPTGKITEEIKEDASKISRLIRDNLSVSLDYLQARMSNSGKKKKKQTRMPKKEMMCEPIEAEPLSDFDPKKSQKITSSQSKENDIKRKNEGAKKEPSFLSSIDKVLIDPIVPFQNEIPVIEVQGYNPITEKEEIPTIESKWNWNHGSKKHSKQKKMMDNIRMDDLMEVIEEMESENTVNEKISESISNTSDIKNELTKDRNMIKSINFLCKNCRSIDRIIQSLESNNSIENLVTALTRVHLLNEGDTDTLLEKYLCVESFSCTKGKLERAQEKINTFVKAIKERKLSKEEIKKLIETVDKKRQQKNAQKIELFRGGRNKIAMGLALAMYSVDAYKNKISDSDIDGAANEVANNFRKQPQITNALCWLLGSFCLLIKTKIAENIFYDVISKPISSEIETEMNIQARAVRAASISTLKGRTKEYVNYLIKKYGSDEKSIKTQSQWAVNDAFKYIKDNNTPGAAVYMLKLIWYTLLWMDRFGIQEAYSEITIVREAAGFTESKQSQGIDKLCSLMTKETINLLTSKNERGDWTLLLPKNADLKTEVVQHLIANERSIKELVKTHLIQNNLTNSKNLSTYKGDRVSRLSNNKFYIAGKEVDISSTENLKYVEDKPNANFIIHIRYIDDIL